MKTLSLLSLKWGILWVVCFSNSVTQTWDRGLTSFCFWKRGNLNPDLVTVATDFCEANLVRSRFSLWTRVNVLHFTYPETLFQCVLLSYGGLFTLFSVYVFFSELAVTVYPCSIASDACLFAYHNHTFLHTSDSILSFYCAEQGFEEHALLSLDSIW